MEHGHHPVAEESTRPQAVQAGRAWPVSPGLAETGRRDGAATAVDFRGYGRYALATATWSCAMPVIDSFNSPDAAGGTMPAVGSSLVSVCP